MVGRLARSRSTLAAKSSASLRTTLRLSFRFARSRWRLEGHVTPDGRPLPARTGILLNVLASDAGAWRIIDSQNTDIVEGVLSRPQ